ncbi:MAG TPA: nucleotidyltransferase family protein, partial [candidate division Zixibacteria bacterium]|nr:nucleotidyltransferase family protein [candidate division Zixibacteria bacterium]HPI33371.1 nucleotidyltransferase family protein [candidate division Zixibacteria bacterium]
MSKRIRVIVPVAGAGTRLQPHTLTLPKALLPVGGKPALAHVLEPLVPLEPEEVVFVIGHLGDQIIDYVRENYRIKARFAAQEKLLGLGYALHLALREMADGPTLVILGDTVVECDYGAFLGAGEYVLGLRSVDNPHRFGVAEVDGGRIVGLEEKPADPRSNLALIGLYYFSDTA